MNDSHEKNKTIFVKQIKWVLIIDQLCLYLCNQKRKKTSSNCKMSVINRKISFEIYIQ